MVLRWAIIGGLGGESEEDRAVFHNMRPEIADRMKTLEARDAADRTDGTPRMERLRQVTRETGKLIALLAASVPEGAFLEVGTSAGYSTLWLALAAGAKGRRVVTTFEVLPEKARLARETFRLAGVEDVVQLVEGDAREHLSGYRGVAFCFLDAEKEVYADVYELVVPQMVTGGLLVADNVTSHQHELQPVVDRALEDRRVDAIVTPIGKGLLICRKV
jgi:caffeoyl-CoA O-methyltransferase